MADRLGGATGGKWETALAQVAVSVLIGLVAAGIAVGFGQAWVAPLIGWDAAALTYLGWTWGVVAKLDADATASLATRPDSTRPGSDVLLLCASLASLAAVGLVIVHASSAHGSDKALQTALGVGSVVISWLIVHTTYTLRYASLYHAGEAGGIDFNEGTAPRYGDFAYVAFTIGMTFQVSDTNLTSSAIRMAALRHALLSYLYGTVIIASAINLVAGLTK
jgi:uncharacterized membrane protein